MKASSDEQEDVMLTKQSTSALPGRLTQVAIYPHLHTYLRRQDKNFSKMIDCKDLKPHSNLHPNGCNFFKPYFF